MISHTHVFRLLRCTRRGQLPPGSHVVDAGMACIEKIIIFLRLSSLIILTTRCQPTNHPAKQRATSHQQLQGRVGFVYYVGWIKSSTQHQDQTRWENHVLLPGWLAGFCPPSSGPDRYRSNPTRQRSRSFFPGPRPVPFH